MNVSLQFKDDGSNPGNLHGEATVEFDLYMKDALKVLQKLQLVIPSIIVEVLSERPIEDDKQ